MSDVLSPTPPVLCLSTLMPGIRRGRRARRSAPSRRSARRSPRRHAAQHDRHEQRRNLVIGQPAGRDAAHHEFQLARATAPRRHASSGSRSTARMGSGKYSCASLDSDLEPAAPVARRTSCSLLVRPHVPHPGARWRCIVLLAHGQSSARRTEAPRSGAQQPTPTSSSITRRLYGGSAQPSPRPLPSTAGESPCRRQRRVLGMKGAETRLIDAGGRAMIPGLHDAHGHFMRLGSALQQMNLRGTTSYEVIVDKVGERVAKARPGEWILGRSWDQNDWPKQDGRRTRRWTGGTEQSGLSDTRRRPRGTCQRRPWTRPALRRTADPAGGTHDSRRQRRSDRRADRHRDGSGLATRFRGFSRAAREQVCCGPRSRRLGLTMVHDAGVGGIRSSPTRGCRRL